jgi:hypothetical protein
MQFDSHLIAFDSVHSIGETRKKCGEPHGDCAALCTQWQIAFPIQNWVGGRTEEMIPEFDLP